MPDKKQLTQQCTPIIINEIDTDYKAEVVAAGLIENGNNANEVCILRLGNATRGYSKDIEYIRPGAFNQSNIRYVGIWTNRAGLYDILPEGVFHSAKKVSYQKNKKEMLAKIWQVKEEEVVAREFFRPLEISINHALINAQLYERKLEKKYANNNFVEVFKRAWPSLGLLPVNKAVLLIEILPLLSRMNLDMETVSLIYSEIMDIPIQVGRGKPLQFNMDKSAIPRLGEARLGINSVIGNKFSNGQYDLVIKIGPITEKQILFYKTTPEGKEIIRFLASLFFPANQEIRYKYTPIPGTARFRLSQDKSKASRLGVNTYL